METIGTIEEAAIAAEFDRTSPIPDGWERIGAGSYRTAYLSPSGVLYKVPHVFGDYLVEANYKEASFSLLFYENLHQPAAQAFIQRAYIPKATLYGDVVAMEYIEKTPLEQHGDIYNLVEWGKLGMHDIGWHNCIKMEDGRIALVDLGNCQPDILEKRIAE